MTAPSGRIEVDALHRELGLEHALASQRLFTDGAEILYDVVDLFRAAEPVDVVAAEFGLSRAEVEDALRVNTRTAA
jgi:hypothetical protein